jgi:hypothetical protein
MIVGGALVVGALAGDFQNDLVVSIFRSVGDYGIF